MIYRYRINKLLPFLVRSCHSHKTTFPQRHNLLTNVSTNLLLSNIQNSIEKQNKILEEINENIKLQNQSLSYILVYIMEDQDL
jgi:hypothetical protein|uniref:Uncharacterized protein n=1 Tax=viral metagenome TaxID=1070528 RepID=A0A6C0JJX5_9ZZZZ